MGNKTEFSTAGGGGGGSPGGADKQVQFNDGGAFGGDAGLTFDKTSDLLTLDGNLKIVSAKSVIDGNSNEVLQWLQVASAVNFLSVQNSATLTAPELQAKGDDADVNLGLRPKGAGGIYLPLSTAKLLQYVNANGILAGIANPSVDWFIVRQLNGAVPVLDYVFRSDMLDVTDDFEAAGAAGTGTWDKSWLGQNSGAGAAASSTAADADHPGILNLATGTTTTGRAAIQLANASSNTMLFGGGAWRMGWLIRFPTLSAVAEEYIARIGFGDSPSGDYVDGAYFEYDRLTSGDVWRTKTANNSARTTNVSATAIAANTWTRLEIVMNAAGTSVDFNVAGVTLFTHTTNIPTGAGRNFCPCLHIIKSAGTTSRSIDIDFFRVIHKLTNARNL